MEITARQLGAFAARIGSVGLFWASCLFWTSNAANTTWPVCDAADFTPVRLGFWVGSTCGMAAMVYLLHRKKELSSRLLMAVSGMLQALGSLIVLLGTAEPILLALGSWLAGFATTGLLPGWRKTFSCGKVRELVYVVASAACLAIGLFEVALILPVEWAKGLLVVYPLLSGLAACFDKDVEVPRFRLRDERACSRPEERKGNKAYRWLYGAFGVFSIAIMGIDSLTYNAPSVLAPIAPSLAIGACVAAILCGGFALLALRQRSLSFPAAIIPFLLAGSLLLPFLSTGTQTILQIAISVNFLCWIILIALGLDEAVSLNTRRVSYELAIALAVVVARIVDETLLGIPNTEPVIVAVVYGFVVASSLLLAFRLGDSMSRGLGTAAARKRAVEAVSARYGLTEREREVLEAVSRGHRQARIAEDLFISQGTVHTHVRHIYEKTDCHSRDEILDLVLREENELLHNA